MNGRAIGCIVLGLGAFVVVAIAGIWVSIGQGSPIGCAGVLRWQDDRYAAIGTPAPSPVFRDPAAAQGDPVLIGSTLVGIATREVYAPHGSAPLPSAGNRPSTISLACGDATFQTYELSR